MRIRKIEYFNNTESIDKLRRYVRVLNRKGNYLEVLHILSKCPREHYFNPIIQQHLRFAQTRHYSRFVPDEFRSMVFLTATVITLYLIFNKLLEKSLLSSIKKKIIGSTLSSWLEKIGEKVDPKQLTEGLSDVKGIDEIKEEINWLIDILRNHKKYIEGGVTVPKGVLLFGSPGTGKTLLARAIAKEADVTFFHCSGSSFDEIYSGVGSSRIRSIFKQAKKNSPCIIFIDEIDALLTKQRRFSMENVSASATINEFLAQMDGFEQAQNILVIGATNDPDSLDKAATRAGRFDIKIHVPLPNAKGREELLNFYLEKVKHSEIETEKFAQMTPQFSGADIKNLINQAAIQAAARDSPTLDLRDLELARDNIMLGMERGQVKRDPKELRRTALHEAGHSLATYYLLGPKSLFKTTIKWRGDDLGGTVSIPDKSEEFGQTKEQLFHKLVILLSGREAETLGLSYLDATSHCEKDLKKATRIARLMVQRFGMCEEYGLSAADPQKTSDIEKSRIEDAVNSLLRAASKKADECISSHFKELQMLSEKLLEKQTLSGEQVSDLLSSATPIPI